LSSWYAVKFTPVRRLACQQEDTVPEEGIIYPDW
jgi:hypothetical protein